MTTEWLIDDGREFAPSSEIRRFLTNGHATAVVGAYDGISALLAKSAGFPALYLSGAALSASKGLPDLGLLTLEDVKSAAADIVRATGLPLLVDCDTGFGEVLNVMRAVRELEMVGVAAIQIEDQQFPKKCGHLNDKKVVTSDEMCRKIAAARKASSTIVICARTDAGFISTDEAIDRANKYAEAGADVIFVEALDSIESIKKVRRQVKAPLLANMTEYGRTPETSLQEWSSYGYNLVIYPVSAFRISARAMETFYHRLKNDGHVQAMKNDMMRRDELYSHIHYYDYEKLDETIATTELTSQQKR